VTVGGRDRRRRRRTSGSFGRSLVGTGADGIHSIAQLTAHVGRLAQHERQNLMARRHLRQMDIRLQADFLKIGHPLAGQRVVEILGDRVGIQAHAAAGHLGRPQPHPDTDIANPVHQVRGELAFLDLSPDILVIRRLEDLVHVSQHRSQCKSHGS